MSHSKFRTKVTKEETTEKLKKFLDRLINYKNKNEKEKNQKKLYYLLKKAIKASNIEFIEYVIKNDKKNNNLFDDDEVIEASNIEIIEYIIDNYYYIKYLVTTGNYDKNNFNLFDEAVFVLNHDVIKIFIDKFAFGDGNVIDNRILGEGKTLKENIFDRLLAGKSELLKKTKLTSGDIEIMYSKSKALIDKRIEHIKKSEGKINFSKRRTFSTGSNLKKLLIKIYGKLSQKTLKKFVVQLLDLSDEINNKEDYNNLNGQFAELILKSTDKTEQMLDLVQFVVKLSEPLNHQKLTKNIGEVDTMANILYYHCFEKYITYNNTEKANKEEGNNYLRVFGYLYNNNTNMNLIIRTNKLQNLIDLILGVSTYKAVWYTRLYEENIEFKTLLDEHFEKDLCFEGNYIEPLVVLLTIVGKKLDEYFTTNEKKLQNRYTEKHQHWINPMDITMMMLDLISQKDKGFLGTRNRFAVKDLHDLRKRGWKPKA